MTKMQGANQKSRHNFVADAQHQSGVKHIVAQRNGRALGNGIAAEKTQLHALGALGDAVAHGGHATGHLSRGAMQTGFFFDDVGVIAVRRMGRQHVVVGRDDANVGGFFSDDVKTVVGGNPGKGVGHVGTIQAVCAPVQVCRTRHHL